jgi:phosphopantothenoylcysteine decarboxylase/phosphopantothenate--cysteine ligase
LAKKVKILITAGPTRESLDPVRFISNRSSGKMGYALAEAAKKQGAEVVLISGPVELKPPKGVKLVRVETTEEMRSAVKKHSKGADIIIMAAAPADYTPTQKSKVKIKKLKSKVKIEFKKTTDILAELGRTKGNKTLIGFSVETNNLIENSRKKLKDKNLDLIVANDASAFGAEESRVALLFRDGRILWLPRMPKRKLAELLLRSLSRQVGL